MTAAQVPSPDGVNIFKNRPYERTHRTARPPPPFCGDGLIAAWPLDTWLSCVDGDVAILKIDVEGAEYAIIEASKLLDICERIEIEWHGAGMAQGADGYRIGALITKLLATHQVEIVGLPEVGGAIHAVRR